MTRTTSGLWISMMAAAVIGYAGTASAQTSSSNHKFLYPHAKAHVDVTAGIDRLDERIAFLTADMKMLTGELKIQAMTDLIEALVERQTLTDRRVHRMQEMLEGPMGEWMPHLGMPSSRPAPDPEVELEPEVMCSPFI